MDLYERLRAQKSGSAGQAGTGSTERDSDVARPTGASGAGPSEGRMDPAAYLDGAGWFRAAEFVWTRERSHAVETLPEGDASLLVETRVENLVYFDTETTGLSGGSGTMVFLVGLGRLSGRRLVVEQIFLEDYPGEPAFLHYLSSRIPSGATFVSYNGKAFDSHVLSMRHLMNGLHFTVPNQIDLLYPTRRLWKTMLKSCSLGDIEEHVLEIAREIDIPGYLIPDTYFDYLRSGDAKSLEAVFEHHREDIVSLHKLLARIETLAADPFAFVADRLQLARLLVARFPERGEALLQRLAAEDGSAALELGFYLKRRRRIDEAFEVFSGLYGRNASPTAGVEIAKHLEHRAKSLSAAKEIVVDLIKRPDCAELREALRYRLERLDRKLIRASS